MELQQTLNVANNQNKNNISNSSNTFNNNSNNNSDRMEILPTIATMLPTEERVRFSNSGTWTASNNDDTTSGVVHRVNVHHGTIIDDSYTNENEKHDEKMKRIVGKESITHKTAIVLSENTMDKDVSIFQKCPPLKMEGTRISTVYPHSNDVDLQSTSHHPFKESAQDHGGKESAIFLQTEKALSSQKTRIPSLVLENSINPLTSTTAKHEKKIGHRRVDEGGEVTYKKIQSKQIMGSIQLGIQHTVGSLASKPKRDLLMNDFFEMETIAFPPDGSSITPAHHYSEFRFKVYAPIAFRYFRDLFGIAPDDFLMSMCAAPLRQLSNPGASGSIFYLTDDDEFIIKTVQKKECEFLQKLLPGYYMNLSQNPRTLLPKFFGLYCFHYNAKNVRLVAMNNLLPSDIKMHAKYDLKGSTFRRKASKAERQKASPTFKDLDFMEHHPNGIFLETDKYNALMKTIQRDCMVLESFQIMDYSLLVGIHNLDLAAKEKREERIRNARAKLQRSDGIRDKDNSADECTGTTPEVDQMPLTPTYSSEASSGTGVVQGVRLMITSMPSTPPPKTLPFSLPSTSKLSHLSATATNLNRSRSMNRQRLVAHSTAMESITADSDIPYEEDEDVPAGGIPARSENDERLLLYIGIIDILQSYRLEKKLEHTFKAIIYNGDTVSVCRPSFYAQRFQNFMGKTVFKKTPTFPLKHSVSKRKSSTMILRSPQRTPSHSISMSGTPASPSAIQRSPTIIAGSTTPPPAFDEISEEESSTISSIPVVAIAGSSSNTSSLVYGQYYNYDNESRNNNSNLQRMQTTSAQNYYKWQNDVEQETTLDREGHQPIDNLVTEYSEDEVTLSGSGKDESRSLRQYQLKRRSPLFQLTQTNVNVTSIGVGIDDHKQSDEGIEKDVLEVTKHSSNNKSDMRATLQSDTDITHKFTSKIILTDHEKR